MGRDAEDAKDGCDVVQDAQDAQDVGMTSLASGRNADVSDAGLIFANESDVQGTPLLRQMERMRGG